MRGDGRTRSTKTRWKRWTKTRKSLEDTSSIDLVLLRVPQRPDLQIFKAVSENPQPFEAMDNRSSCPGRLRFRLVGRSRILLDQDPWAKSPSHPGLLHGVGDLQVSIKAVIQ